MQKIFIDAGKEYNKKLADESSDNETAPATNRLRWFSCQSIISVMNSIGTAWVFVLLIIINLDIGGRALFNHPIVGVPEMIRLGHRPRFAVGVNYFWSVCAAGRHQFTMCNLALLMGGNTRVGLEPATPEETRKILNLKGTEKTRF